MPDIYDFADNLYDKLNIKIAFIIFVVYLLLNSDIFIETTLSKVFNGVYDVANDRCTEKSIIINGVVLSFVYIVIDLLNKQEVI